MITTDTGAKKLGGTDNWRQIIPAHNESMEAHDRAVTGAQSGLAIIVDGDTCTQAVPAGGYAYIRNNTHGLAEGLYRNKTNSNYPVSGTEATATIFEAVSSGGLNALNTQLTGQIAAAIAALPKTKKINKSTNENSHRLNINNLVNNSQHFLLISSVGTGRFAILGVRVTGEGTVFVAEIYRGSDVSVYEVAANKIVLQFDTHLQTVNIYDILMNGDTFIS